MSPKGLLSLPLLWLFDSPIEAVVRTAVAKNDCMFETSGELGIHGPDGPDGDDLSRML